MRLCPCTGGIKRCRCTCKSFGVVANYQESIYEEAMYTCNCVIGRRFGKCANPHHIEALELRAATFAALGQLDNAMKDAEWILELAPQLPDVSCPAVNITKSFQSCISWLTSPDTRDTFVWGTLHSCTRLTTMPSMPGRCILLGSRLIRILPSTLRPNCR